MYADFTTYLVISLAIYIMGFSKAGLGGGLGAMTVPICLLVLPPSLALAAVLPVLIILDMWIMKTYWKKINRQLLKFIIPLSVLGLAIGMLTFQYLSTNIIRVIVGVVSIVFAFNFYIKKLRNTQYFKTPGKVLGVICSISAGFTTFVAHAGGPPLSLYLLPMRLEPKAYIATFGGFVAISNILKILPYSYLAFFSAESLKLSAVMLPAALLGVLSGFVLVRYVKTDTFYNICYCCMLVMGIKLMYDGLF